MTDEREKLAEKAREAKEATREEFKELQIERSYRCPETGEEFDHWEVTEVTSFGYTYAECPCCGASKTDAYGNTRSDHIVGRYGSD